MGTGQSPASASTRGVSLSDRVYTELVDMIIHGDLEPGCRVREMAIAAQLGTSRVPVREAIQRLADEGWLTRRPRAGATVPVPTAQDIDDVFEMRQILEVAAIERAARHISLAHIEMLQQVIADGKAAAAREDQRAVVQANKMFHGATAELSRNRLLIDVLANLDKRVRWLFSSVALARSGESLVEHEAILAALERRDVPRAMVLTTAHIEATRSALHRQWADQNRAPDLRTPRRGEATLNYSTNPTD